MNRIQAVIWLGVLCALAIFFAVCVMLSKGKRETREEVGGEVAIAPQKKINRIQFEDDGDYCRIVTDTKTGKQWAVLRWHTGSAPVVVIDLGTKVEQKQETQE